MTDAVSLPWSQRRYAWFLLVAAFILGVCAGLVLAATWDVDRITRQNQRRVDELLAQVQSRPTLHQRLDVIEEHLQVIEGRLNPLDKQAPN